MKSTLASKFATIFAILLPFSAAAQNSYTPLFDRNVSARFIFSISSDTSWHVEVDELDSRFELFGGFIQAYDQKTNTNFAPYNLTISTLEDPHRAVVQIQCTCRVLSERHQNKFLIVDVINLGHSDDFANSTTYRHPQSFDISNWWDRRSPNYSPKDHDIETSDNIVNVAVNDSVPPLREDERTKLPNAINRRHLATNIEPNEASRIGIQTSLNTTDSGRGGTVECPLKNLYEDNENYFTEQALLEKRLMQDELYTTSGNIDEQGVLSHATNLLQLGLIPEAIQTLKLSKEPSLANGIVLKVASVILGSEKVTFNDAELNVCTGVLDIWLMMSGLRSTDTAKSLAALQFKALPKQLQNTIQESFLRSFDNTEMSTEIEAFMNHTSNTPVQPRLEQSNIESNALVQANRDHPERVIDLLRNPSRLASNDLMEFSEAIRKQNRGTNLWDQILGSEIVREIDNRAYGSAASKINTMILEKSPQAEIHRYSNHLVNELLDNETSTTILSFYMSDELDHWPSIIKDRIASQISNIGMAHLVNAENGNPDHPRISQGFVIGPNQQYVSVGRIDNLNHDMSPHGIQRSLEQTTEFKNMLLNVLQSE